jgi:hypothetical protein
VPNVFDDDVFAGQPELRPKISGSQSVMPHEFSPQRLGSADGWPFFKPIQQPIHSAPDRLW